MRVLHVTTEYPPLVYGGLGTAVGGLVRASACAGIEVAVLLVGGGESAYQDGARSNTTARVTANPTRTVAIHAVPHDGSPEAAVEFARRWRPDVVHLHVFWLAHVALAIREATGIPIVYTVHSLDRAEYEIGQGPPQCLSQWEIQRDLIRSADRIVALTDDERLLIEAYCDSVGSRIRIVGNGIEDSRRAKWVSRHRRARRDGVRVLYSGRFVERKGIRELLDAIQRVAPLAPSAQFVLAGGHRHSSGEDVARYWLPTCDDAIRARITFTGWLDEAQLAAWYEWADILVVPSWYEPFGMVVLEGMLYGLAVVAADVGGPRAILTDRVTGLLCPPKDSVALADALMRLIEDHRLRRRLSRNGARDVRARWLLRDSIARMRDVYEGVM